jgi:4-hydroxybenzoate polyprenyltransferase
MRTVGALLRAAHPVPAAGVTLIVVLLGVAVGLEPWRLVVLGATLGLNQLAIGLSNDWLDADRDRASGRSDKPVASGEVGAGTARNVAFGAAGLSILVSVLLGVPFVLVHAVAFAGGWIYNAWLKHTAFSALPYLLSFGLLPALATFALPEPALPAWWAVLAGALLGLAAHIANVLPDLADDDATGVRGMPHRLGPRIATIVAGLALIGAAAALSAGIGISSAVALAGFGLSLAASIAAIVLGLRGSRWAFRLVILAALVDVAMLVLAGSRMIVPF